MGNLGYATENRAQLLANQLEWFRRGWPASRRGRSTTRSPSRWPVVTTKGAKVTLFGTEPLFRAHPEGMYTQVAAALW